MSSKAGAGIIFTSESELVEPLMSTRADVVWYREVPLFKKMIDVYATNMETGDTYAFELKLRDWRRALVQSSYYLLVTDFVSVVLPRKTAERALTDEALFRKLGIGLLAVDEKTETLIEAKRSTSQLREGKKELLEFLEGRPDKAISDKV